MRRGNATRTCRRLSEHKATTPLERALDASAELVRIIKATGEETEREGHRRVSARLERP
jgi:hypothetical protein